MNTHTISDKKIRIKQVEQSWKALSDTQKQIIKDKQITGEHTLKEWLSLLTKLSEYSVLNAQGLKLIKPTGVRYGVLVLGVVVLLLVLKATRVPDEIVTIAIGLCVIIGGAYLVYVAFLLSCDNKYRSRLISDNLSLFILPLLKLLQTEVADNEQVNIYAYLGEKNQYQHIVEGRDAHKPKTATTTFFQHCLLEITTKFCDKTQINLVITDRVRQRVIRKISQSGKPKNKIKHKTKITCRVSLSFLRKNYTSKPLENQSKVIQKEKYLCFKNKKTMEHEGGSSVPHIHLPLGIIADIYQQVEQK